MFFGSLACQCKTKFQLKTIYCLSPNANFEYSYPPIYYTFSQKTNTYYRHNYHSEIGLLDQHLRLRYTCAKSLFNVHADSIWVTRITKVLIRLRRCAGWSASLLFANLRKQVFSQRGPYLILC